MNSAPIVAENLVRHFGEVKAVDGINLTVNQGEIFGFLGPNGAGKTTIFYMMVGLVKPEEGRVLLQGRDLSQAPLHERSREGIGYLPQEPSTIPA